MSLIDPPFAHNEPFPRDNADFPPEQADIRPAIIHEHERFLLRPIPRIAYMSLTAYGIGSVLGYVYGFRTAALRFRAENSHRTPLNQRGWYLYHRAKNAHALKQALKEGNRMGFRLVPWVALFFGIEEAMDQVRMGDAGHEGRKDFISTTVAGGAVAGGFSLWQRFPAVVAARMVQMGLGVGVGLGLAQDMIFWARGDKIGWIRLVGRLFGRGEKDIAPDETTTMLAEREVKRTTKGT